VTRADVQKAAAQIFQKNHRTVGVLSSPQEPATPATPAAEAKP
jgi:predicted Zn-dependent peptidase